MLLRTARHPLPVGTPRRALGDLSVAAVLHIVPLHHSLRVEFSNQALCLFSDRMRQFDHFDWNVYGRAGHFRLRFRPLGRNWRLSRDGFGYARRDRAGSLGRRHRKLRHRHCNSHACGADCDHRGPKILRRCREPAHEKLTSLSEKAFQQLRWFSGLRPRSFFCHSARWRRSADPAFHLDCFDQFIGGLADISGVAHLGRPHDQFRRLTPMRPVQPALGQVPSVRLEHHSFGRKP
jgi:hypothetical protein